MSVPEQRLQAILAGKDQRAALESVNEYRYVEGWAICDGALVIYDVDDPPAWFEFERDEDGNTPGGPVGSDEVGDSARLTVPGRRAA